MPKNSIKVRSKWPVSSYLLPLLMCFSCSNTANTGINSGPNQGPLHSFYCVAPGGRHNASEYRLSSRPKEIHATVDMVAKGYNPLALVVREYDPLAAMFEPWNKYPKSTISIKPFENDKILRIKFEKAKSKDSNLLVTVVYGRKGDVEVFAFEEWVASGEAVPVTVMFTNVAEGETVLKVGNEERRIPVRIMGTPNIVRLDCYTSHTKFELLDVSY